MTPWLRALALALTLTAVPVGAGVWLGNEGASEPETVTYRPTDLASYDTSKVTIQRRSFCDQIPGEAVDEALGDAHEQASKWTDGEEPPGTDDVGHEYGCDFTGPMGTEAAAWVFAPPVTREHAQRLAKTPVGKQCSRPSGAPEYGDPSAIVLCGLGGRRQLTFRGLFGDAWLTCQLTLPAGVPDKELIARTGRWCVDVARAASS